MSSAAKLRELSDEALTHQMFEIERTLVAARFQHSMGALENTASLGNLRRQIAQMKQEARSREIERGLPKASLFRLHRGGSQPVAAGESGQQEASEEGGFLQGIVDKLTNKD